MSVYVYVHPPTHAHTWKRELEQTPEDAVAVAGPWAFFLCTHPGAFSTYSVRKDLRAEEGEK